MNAAAENSDPADRPPQNRPASGGVSALSPEERELHQARKRATRLLAARDRSHAELEERLAGAGFAAAAIARVLAEFTKAGLLNDAALADRTLRRELDRAPAGRSLLRGRLERKGIDEQLTDQAVESAVGKQDELAQAVRAAALRLHRISDASRLADGVLAGRLVGFVARRGFEPDVAREAVEIILRRSGLWRPADDEGRA